MLRALDLFCGAGGATKGLQRAGFHVTGVDNKPQPRYCGDVFVQADAMEHPLEGFDFIWASPPCQDHMRVGQHPIHGTGWMLGATRERLNALTVTDLGFSAMWVIENVPGAPLRVDVSLCGCMFGLKHLRRERWFETNFWSSLILMPAHDHREKAISIVGNGTPSWVRAQWGRCPTVEEQRAAMGIDWMVRKELSQAIPPAYSEFIGRQAMRQIQEQAPECVTPGVPAQT